MGAALFCWLLGGVALCEIRMASAQSPPPQADHALSEQSNQISDTSPAQEPAQPSGSASEDNPGEESKETKEGEKKKHHRGAIVVAPLPVVSPAIGAGIIPVLGYIFPFQEKDKTSPPSVIGAAGLGTNNGSRGFGVGGDLFMKEDRYELRSFYARGNINYDLYGVGYANGNANLKLPLVQTGQIFFVEFLRNIAWKIFAGPRFVNGNSLITLNATKGLAAEVPPDVGVQTNLRAVGFRVVRDSRINRFYPTQGMLLDFTGDFFSQGLGSKYSFQSYKFTFDKYFSLGTKQVLAYNLFLCGTGGEPPFYGNCIYGMNNELRGYQAGRYLDRYMYATQLEYRVVLPWRFGVVAFGGLGSVAPGVDKFRSDQFLPAGGMGIRFLLSKKYHVNFRTDFAWGKDVFSWSVGVGEAF
jgi:Omp85 superfamily domain